MKRACCATSQAPRGHAAVVENQRVEVGPNLCGVRQLKSDGGGEGVGEYTRFTRS